MRTLDAAPLEARDLAWVLPQVLAAIAFVASLPSLGRATSLSLTATLLILSVLALLFISPIVAAIRDGRLRLLGLLAGSCWLVVAVTAWFIGRAAARNYGATGDADFGVPFYFATVVIIGLLYSLDAALSFVAARFIRDRRRVRR